MIVLWARGLVRRRAGRLLGLVAGVAVAVALLASLGSFLSSAKAGMTRQAVRAVAVDWQVAVTGPVDAALATVRSEPGVLAAVPVGLAVSDGLTAMSAAGTAQQTGQARVLGLGPGYAAAFLGELRLLSGSIDTSAGAALLAQQTASNLAARVGDTITVRRPGATPLQVRVGGVVDLPQADSLFQKVGAAPGAQASAPPDNVVLMDLSSWHTGFDPVAAAHPEVVTAQVHVARDRRLPPDPAAAYALVVTQAHHLESRLAGAGLVGDNLAATLDTARKDALYAQVLFVFLGLPGAFIAAALTATAAAAGAGRRRREQGLLRLRGATSRQVLRLAAVEALAVGVIGAVLGLAAASVVGLVAFGDAGFGATARSSLVWGLTAAIIGILVAVGVVLGPARRDLRDATVAASRGVTAGAARAQRTPLLLRLGVDLWLLVGAFLVYRVTSRDGYSLVLAPEGVPSISVNYGAFSGPAMLWLGAAGLTWRLVDLVLRRGRGLLVRLARPLAGRLSFLAVASASRQSRLVTRASVLAGLALAFAASTAVFNGTYQAQAGVDARLTNGADVAVTTPPGTVVAADLAGVLTAVPGVRSAEPLMHRYAYIGADLQDLYGVRPETVAAATTLQDGYFTGGTAAALMATLARQPDAILVSSETVKDYQLRLGDSIVLRLQDTRSQATTPVTFHYAGVAKEFPTAPHDSFFVTNASYVASATGNPAIGTYLLSAPADPPATAAAVRSVVGGTSQVTDVTTTRTAVGSSLTAVDLSGLTRVELVFALLLALGGGGLVLGLGLAERRRDLAVVAALGATRRQLGALVHVETALVCVTSLIAGAVTGTLLSLVLVRVLTGVFDPAPEHLATPWPYLDGVAALSVAGTVAASALVARLATRAVTSQLRGL